MVNMPDVIGFTQKEGSLLLQNEGYRIEYKYTGDPFFKNNRIIRQRLLSERSVELVVCNEYYSDPAFDEEKV